MRSEREGGMGSSMLVMTARVVIAIMLLSLAGLGYFLWQRWSG